MKKIIYFCFLFAVFLLSACTPRALENPRISSRTGTGNLPVNHSNNQQVASMSVEEKLVEQGQIKKFASAEELQEFLENNDSSGARYGRAYHDDMVFAEEAAFVMDTADGAPTQALTKSSNEAAGRGGGSDDFSKTNVQVEGVDEADIIKTDGEYVYAVVRNDLYIARAWPADRAEVITKISFKDRPNDIYINEDRLVIYGNDYEVFENEDYAPWRRRGQYTFVKVFDIKNPVEPKQIRDLKFEGNPQETRMIGDYVYLVTNNYNFYYIEGEPLLPRVIDNGEEYKVDCVSAGVNAKCVFPDVYYFDMPYDSHNFTAVNSINIKDGDEKIQSEVYVMSSSQNIFVSLNNLYITYTKYISEYELEQEVMKDMLYPVLSSRDQEKISNIIAVENYVLSENEKRYKVAAVVERYLASLTDEEQKQFQEDLGKAMRQKYEDISKELEKTVIHKVAINKGRLEYQASGEVTGHVLNQFSMDEDKGYFRIATTRNRTWSHYLDSEEEQESYSNLYVLDKSLNVVGGVEKLAPGERIYSVRFMQDRAYLVTFKQVDPLFVIDLSQPSKPSVLGELKIPGFSNYLHPYDENFLIGIGKDTVETEWGGVRTKGVKLSLFDVRDVKNPKEVDVYVMGDSGSNSIALNDHKAFLFSKDKNLLVLPVSIQEQYYKDEQEGPRATSLPRYRMNFRGAAVFKIDESGFELKGKIDHAEGDFEGKRDYWRGYSYYDNTVKRSLYISDTLYTFSNNYLMMNNIETLDEEAKLKLEKKKTSSGDDFEIIN